MDSIFMRGVAIIALIALIIFIFRAIKGIEFNILREHERLAIYRMGRFRRIRGPGLVIVWQTLGTKALPFDVREHPMEQFVPPVFINGLPVGLTFNFWCAFDPETTVASNRIRFNDLFQMEERERQQEIGLRLKECVADEISILTRRDKLPENPELFHRLMPVLPGFPQRAELLQNIRSKLTGEIRNLGYRLSADNPIIISRLHLPDEMGKTLNRGRIVELLRSQFPDLADEEIAHILASIEGRPAPNLQKFVVQGDTNAQIETRRKGDQTEEHRLRFAIPKAEQKQTDGSTTQAGGTDHQGDSATSNAQSAKPAVDRSLSDNDLSVLTPVPRLRDRQLTA